jgi:hypothetical protein
VVDEVGEVHDGQMMDARCLHLFQPALPHPSPKLQFRLQRLLCLRPLRMYRVKTRIRERFGLTPIDGLLRRKA